MQNKSQFRKGNKMFSKGKFSLISSIVGSLGYFIINDLKKENSLIKNTLKKIPYLNKTLIKTDEKNKENYRVVDDSVVIKKDEK